MPMTDVLSDMLARINNGQNAKLSTINAVCSKLCANVLEVLKKEGFIRDYSEVSNDNGLPELKIELKYVDGEAAIREISRVSKPGRRVYSAISDLPKYFNGLGVTILSTSHGVMSDFEARRLKVGGEVLCSVF